MPLIVYLYGSQGRGNDLEPLLSIEEFPKFLAEGTLGKVPAFALIPRLPSDKSDRTAMKETVVSVIQKVTVNDQINSGNVSLTGFSMGGAGVWNIADSYPELFRCIAPCSRGVRSAETTLSALSNMKIWTFVGTEDVVVRYQPTIDFMKQLTRVDFNGFVLEWMLRVLRPVLLFPQPASYLRVENEEIPTRAQLPAKPRIAVVGISELAAGEGFEPSHTESESAVLPLHKPAVSVRLNEQILLYRKEIFCQGLFPILLIGF